MFGDKIANLIKIGGVTVADQPFPLKIANHALIIQLPLCRLCPFPTTAVNRLKPPQKGVAALIRQL